MWGTDGGWIKVAVGQARRVCRRTWTEEVSSRKVWWDKASQGREETYEYFGAGWGRNPNPCCWLSR